MCVCVCVCFRASVNRARSRDFPSSQACVCCAPARSGKVTVSQPRLLVLPRARCVLNSTFQCLASFSKHVIVQGSHSPHESLWLIHIVKPSFNHLYREFSIIQMIFRIGIRVNYWPAIREISTLLRHLHMSTLHFSSVSSSLASSSSSTASLLVFVFSILSSNFKSKISTGSSRVVFAVISGGREVYLQSR